jgi:hypothetical protein
MRKTIPFISVLLATVLAVGVNAASAIGAATARGYFVIDQSRVYGNSTILDGTAVATAAVPAEVRLNAGVQLAIAPQSSVRIYRDRVVLEKNRALLKARRAYLVETLGLQIVPGAQTVVTVSPDRRVHVEAVSGLATVSKANGLLLARLAPGKALEFDPQNSGGAGSIVLTGSIKEHNGHFLLTAANGLTYELQGNVKTYVGKSVEITGSLVPGAQAASGAVEVVQVLTIKVAAMAGAGGATGGTGISLATKLTIGGIVVAAAVAGTAYTLTQEEARPPVSR